MASRSAAQTQRLSSSLLVQTRGTSAWLGTLSSPDFVLPSVVGDWSVLELVGHLVYLILDVCETLESVSNTRAVDLGTHLRTLELVNSRMTELSRRTVDHEDGRTMIRQLVTALVTMEARLSQPLPGTVLHWGEPVRVSDYLRSVLIEIVAHSDDLSQSLRHHPELKLDRPALAETVRSLNEAIALQHPGQAIELRIPPVSAVQLAIGGSGPTHTRGTPPSVVETDQLTFLRLCSGRRRWSDAVSSGELRASGVHADLGVVFPLLHL